MSDYKFSRTTGTVVFDGRRYHLGQDDPWVANDPLVKARPDLFSDAPERVFTSGGARSAPAEVETATRRPGERRSTRRA